MEKKPTYKIQIEGKEKGKVFLNVLFQLKYILGPNF